MSSVDDAESNRFVAQLPSGATIEQIAFVAERAADQTLLLEFPQPLRRQAVIVKGDTSIALTVLSIPIAVQDALTETESDLFGKMRQWVDAALGANSSPSIAMTFQGAQLCWSPGRMAILAQPDRLENVKRALVEVSYHEAELREIERALGEAWPEWETDLPLSFEFEERSVNRRKQLRQRFQQVLLLRARLARIGPHVHCPHLHPPTLASQIGERLRERTRMLHRHEFLAQQVEVFERVYEMCGERVSDFMAARTGHMLEWIIIVLLLTQLLLNGFEILTSMSK